jgi:uncharacterized protein (DUF697 family)
MTTTNTATDTPAQELSDDEKLARLSQAQETVNKYAMGSMAVGFIPLPLIDLAALTATQLKMLQSLANQYEIEFSQEVVKSLVASLLGGVMPVSAASSLASLIKVVPVIGQASGMISMATMGAAGTYAVGTVFIEHFESGGTFLTFDAEKVKEKFQILFEEGKHFVTKMKNGNKHENETRADTHEK